MDLVRFDAKVARPADGDGCWLWTGTRTRTDGRTAYGQVKRDGRMVLAHRVALETALGRALGDGMLALHRCDNSLCVNPAHLYEGDASQNLRDSWERGARATTGRPPRCKRGHEIAIRHGRRRCQTCDRDSERQRRLAAKQLRMLGETGGNAS